MSNQPNIHPELIQELSSLRQRNAELEQSEAERKRKEDALKLSERMLRVVMDSMDDIVAVFDINGIVKFVTLSYQKTLGYKKDELVGQNAFEYIHPDDREQTIRSFARVMETGNESEVFRFRHRDGRYILFEGVGSIMRDDEGSVEGIVVSCREISERKRLEEELKQHRDHLVELVRERTVELRMTNDELLREIAERKQAEDKIRMLNVELQDRLQQLVAAKALEEEAKRAKSKFLANISHELTTPLNSIIGFSQVLLGKNFGDLNEKQQRYMENILNSGERLHETLKNIVNFVRMDVSNPDMNWEDFRLKDIADSCLSAFRKAAIDRHLTLTLDMEKKADRLIRADRGKLIQVFQNLLSNAVKFTPDGGSVRVSARRVNSESADQFSGTADADFIEISVADTGIGIKEEDLPGLFLNFKQLEAPLTKRFAGVGMGLALTRKLIEAHGGAIRVESDDGKGTRVIFTIPVFGGKREASFVKREA